MSTTFIDILVEILIKKLYNMDKFFEVKRYIKRVIIVICAILGMIVGVALGEALVSTPYLSWLSIGGEIGLKSPITIDLNFLQFTVGLWCKINIAGVLCMVVFALLAQQIVRITKL